MLKRRLINLSDRSVGGFLLLVVLAIAGLTYSQTAFASHFDSMFKTSNTGWNCSDGGTFCQTDNSSFTWYPESTISSAGYDTLQLVMAYEFDPTDLTAIQQSSPSYSGGSETDVIFQAGYVPNGGAGTAVCDDAVSSTQCDQHYIVFNTSSPEYALACHETGHAVGLTHGANAYPAQADSTWDLGCMGTARTVLGSHNQSQINSTY